MSSFECCYCLPLWSGEPEPSALGWIAQSHTEKIKRRERNFSWNGGTFHFNLKPIKWTYLYFTTSLSLAHWSGRVATLIGDLWSPSSAVIGRASSGAWWWDAMQNNLPKLLRSVDGRGAAATPKSTAGRQRRKTTVMCPGIIRQRRAMNISCILCKLMTIFKD